jgi:mono/diheme cytochrome c family protein
MKSAGKTLRSSTTDHAEVFLVFFLAVIVTVSVAGFRGTKTTHRPIEIFPDMDRQPKYVPQHTSEFFADGRAERPPVPGTVPMGYAVPGSYYASGASNNRAVAGVSGFSSLTSYYETGKIGEVWGDGIPFASITPAVMERGRQRFEINCAICHGADAAGDGVIKSYGLATIATLQDDRIRAMPDGEIFNTITHGKNTMNAYGPVVAVEDRWCIIAYLRALQRSQVARLSDVPEAMRAELDKPAAAGKAQ